MIPLGTLAGSRYAAPASDWTPVDLPGLYAWYDAADEDTIVDNGGAVQSWEDKSGNGLILRAGSLGAQTGATSRNELNVLDFGGSGYMMTQTPGNWAFLHNGTAVLVGIVFVPDSLSTMAIMDSGGLGLHAPGAGFGFLDTGEIRNLAGSQPASMAVDNSSGAGTSPAAWQAVTTLLDADATPASARSRIWINSSGPYANNTSTASTTTAMRHPMRIGSQVDDTTPFTGSVAEVVIAASGETDERAALASYLMTKWGIT